jgi:hypothetical protein
MYCLIPHLIHLRHRSVRLHVDNLRDTAASEDVMIPADPLFEAEGSQELNKVTEAYIRV